MDLSGQTPQKTPRKARVACDIFMVRILPRPPLARLDGHKYQGVMACYHGVPLLSGVGALWGTLCHFDVVQRLLSDAEFDLLQSGARSLPGHLKVR